MANGFGFCNSPIEKTDPESEESTATATDDQVIISLASALHTIATNSHDVKAVRMAVNALVRNGISFEELES